MLPLRIEESAVRVDGRSSSTRRHPAQSPSPLPVEFTALEELGTRGAAENTFGRMIQSVTSFGFVLLRSGSILFAGSPPLLAELS